MPDISKCTGRGCPIKDSCYRYTVEPGFRQSYLAVPPVDSNGECEYYWKNGKVL